MRDIPACCSSDATLDALPTREGFRLRGLEMTRVETFTDAAFAFALTLLVISIDQIPSSFAELTSVLKGVPAFLGSAALIMMFWYAHHAWSRRFGLDDGRTVLLSTALVVTTLIYVYPLKFMFNCFLTWMTGGWLDTGVHLDAARDLNGIFIVYGIGFSLMAFLIVALNRHALCRADDLRLDAVERLHVHFEMRAYLALAGIGILSIALALLTPPTVYGLPGWAYALLPIIMPIIGHRADRRIRAQMAAASS